MREYLFRGFHPDESGIRTITLKGNKIKGEWVILNEDFDEVFTVEWDEDTARFVIEGNGVCYDFEDVMDYQIQVVGNKWQEVEE